MKTVIAIDPGTFESAYVIWDGRSIADKGIVENEKMLDVLQPLTWCAADEMAHLLIEKVESYGMAVGEDVFETVFWSGRFAEFWLARGGQVERIGRRAVKLHHCNSARAKDSNIRAALLDKYPAGRKDAPGPAYGVVKHMLAAFALATYWTEAQAYQTKTPPVAVTGGVASGGLFDDK